jgi:hypothetical protein
MKDNCSICGRTTPEEHIEKHHLVPRAKHGKVTAPVCCDCGKQIHQLFTNSELKTSYNTLELIRADERIKKWIQWIRNRKEFGTVCMRRKK